MIVFTLEQIPEYLKRRKETWKNERDRWWVNAQLNEEYYYNDVQETGTNFTVEQLKKIYKEGSGVPVSINFIHPIVNHKLALMTKSTPSFKVAALDQRGKPFAYVLDKLVKHIMYKSEALGEEEETIKNMLLTGIGISGIEETPEYKQGDLPVKYVNIHPIEVILDANSRKRSLADMRGYFVEKEMPEDEFINYYGDLLNQINNLRIENNLDTVDVKYFSNKTSPVNKRTKAITALQEYPVLVTEYYDKVFTRMYYVKDIETNTTVKLFAENIDIDLQGILETAEYYEDNKFVRRTLIWGNYIVLTEILPITDFKIKVKFFEWGGRPYRSYGAVHFIREMQNIIDKAIQQMIVNGMLTNNAAYLVPEGSIDDTNRNNWEGLSSKPGVLKEYRIVNIEGNILKPEKEQIQPLSNFYPQLIEMMRIAMETSTAINSAVTGNPNINRIDVFSTLQQYQNAAMERIALALNHINVANEQLGNVLIEYLLNTLRPEQVIVLLDRNQKFDEVMITQEMLLNSQMSKFTLLSVKSELLPSQKMAQSIEMFKIAQTTQDPYKREVYIKKAFELSDIKNFDLMQEELNTIQELQNQLQQYQMQIERDKELMKQYENRALLAEYNEKLIKLVMNTVAGINKKLLSADDVSESNKENKNLMIDELNKLIETVKDSLNTKNIETTY